MVPDILRLVIRRHPHLGDDDVGDGDGDGDGLDGGDGDDGGDDDGGDGGGGGGGDAQAYLQTGVQTHPHFKFGNIGFEIYPFDIYQQLNINGFTNIH